VSEAEVGSLSTYDAVRLFIRRASAVRRAFALTATNAAAIAAICVRLDGMPLALELAAARTRSMSPEVLLPRLDHALTILTGGSRDLPSRQQTLRATIAWSYDVLTHEQQQLLDRLSVFRSSFTLEAAEAVCGPVVRHDPDLGDDSDLDVLTGLTGLVDHSLVNHQPSDSSAPDRYTTLVSVHEYAADQLDHAGHTAVMRDRHARYFTELVAGRPDRTREDEDRGGELTLQEIVELQAAFEHLRTAPVRHGESTLAFKIADAAAGRGLLTDARTAIDMALARTAPGPAGRIELLLHRSVIEHNVGQTALGEPHARAAVADARALGDASLLAGALASIIPRTRAEGAVLLAEGRSLLESLPATGTYWPRWSVRDFWASTHMLYVDPDWAESINRRSWEESVFVDGPMAGLNLAYVLLARGRLAEAEPLFTSLEQRPSNGPSAQDAIGLYHAAMMRSASREPSAALEDLDRAEAHLEHLEMPGLRRDVAVQRAVAGRLLGDVSGAIEILRALIDDVEDSEPRRVADVNYLLAVLARESGDDPTAAANLGQAWSKVAGRDGRCLDLVLECLLERAVQITATDPGEATRLVGLVNTHRGDFSSCTASTTTPTGCSPAYRPRWGTRRSTGSSPWPRPKSCRTPRPGRSRYEAYGSDASTSGVSCPLSG